MKNSKTSFAVSNKTLIFFFQKIPILSFGLGAVTGFGIVLAGSYSQNDDPGKALICSASVACLLLIFILLCVFHQTKLIRELKSRLNS